MRLLLRLAFGNLLAHRTKSLVVGALMAFGTALVVIGLALLDGSEAAMRRSITGSIAGDFQIYDANAPDPLVLLGSTFISVPDIGRIKNFEAVRTALSDVEGVEAVVPMGFDIGQMGTPGELDRAIEALGAAREDGPEAVARMKQALWGLVEELATELENEKSVAASASSVQEKIDTLQAYRPGSPLWSRFDEAPAEVIEQLETGLAPLGSAGEQVLFRFLGTDPTRFAQHFQGFAVAKGEAIPPGHRGYMFSDKYYERRLKHRVARSLDNLADNVELGELIADDPGQQARVRKMARQTRRITRQLDAGEAAEVKAGLLDYFGESEGELEALLERFLEVDDSNLGERRALFYSLIGPRIELYRIHPGDTVTVRAYTRTGFLRAVNLTFYGTFTFRGLESSDLAGVYNLMDLVSFRHLHGVMNDAERAELASLRAEVELSEASAGEALEDALFGEGAEVEAAADTSPIPELEAAAFGGAEERGLADTFDTATLERGLVLDAAVVLEPDADPKALRPRLQAALDAAQLELQITDWQASSGLIGQFIVVVRLVLYIAVGVIFMVAVVIINNTMVMAMMERVKEIGTLRAVGAQRRLIMGMVFVETAVLGLLSGGLGAGLGAGLVRWWGRTGLDAPSRQLHFVFGGPELYPELLPHHLLVGFTAILVVSVLSTAYPAALAASVQPVEAMRTEE